VQHSDSSLHVPTELVCNSTGMEYGFPGVAWQAHDLVVLLSFMLASYADANTSHKLVLFMRSH
jgi:hypothetical protein